MLFESHHLELDEVEVVVVVFGDQVEVFYLQRFLAVLDKQI